MEQITYTFTKSQLKFSRRPIFFSTPSKATVQKATRRRHHKRVSSASAKCILWTYTPCHFLQAFVQLYFFSVQNKRKIRNSSAVCSWNFHGALFFFRHLPKPQCKKPRGTGTTEGSVVRPQSIFSEHTLLATFCNCFCGWLFFIRRKTKLCTTSKQHKHLGAPPTPSLLSLWCGVAGVPIRQFRGGIPLIVCGHSSQQKAQRRSRRALVQNNY